MSIQNLRRWHWILIGIIVGIIVGQARSLSLSDRPVGGTGFMTQAAFESKLRFLPDMGNPHLKNIVIHPTNALDLVSLSELDTATLQYHDRWFAAPRPYVPLQQGGGNAVQADYLVADYLHEAAETNPAIRFSNAWWESSGGAIALWGAGGALLIGGVWPFVLNFLVGAGFGPKVKDPEYDLNRFSSEVETETKTELTEEELRRLEQLEAEMIAGLAASGQTDVAASKSAASSPIRELPTETVAPIQADAGEAKDFAGEFYPVEKKSPHGFTLVEILVVVGILAVLIGIALPIMSHARARSQQVKCASNLGQIGAGLELYSQSYRHLPQVATAVGLADALKAISIEGIMTCPADQTGGFSYTLNASYAGMPKSSGDASEVLASEATKRHDGKQNIVFFDGHVDER